MDQLVMVACHEGLVGDARDMSGNQEKAPIDEEHGEDRAAKPRRKRWSGVGRPDVTFVPRREWHGVELSALGNNKCLGGSSSTVTPQAFRFQPHRAFVRWPLRANPPLHGKLGVSSELDWEARHSRVQDRSLPWRLPVSPSPLPCLQETAAWHHPRYFLESSSLLL